MFFRGFDGTGKNAPRHQQRPPNRKGAELCCLKPAAWSDKVKGSSLIAGLFWNRTSSCKRPEGTGVPDGAMLGGGASRGGAREGAVGQRGEREGQEEDRKRNTMFAAGSETHRQTQTCTYSYTVSGRGVPEPRRCSDRPLVGGAPVGERRAVTRQLIWG